MLNSPGGRKGGSDGKEGEGRRKRWASERVSWEIFQRMLSDPNLRRNQVVQGT